MHTIKTQQRKSVADLEKGPEGSGSPLILGRSPGKKKKKKRKKEKRIVVGRKGQVTKFMNKFSGVVKKQTKTPNGESTHEIGFHFIIEKVTGGDCAP